MCPRALNGPRRHLLLQRLLARQREEHVEGDLEELDKRHAAVLWGQTELSHFR